MPRITSYGLLAAALLSLSAAPALVEAGGSRGGGGGGGYHGGGGYRGEGYRGGYYGGYRGYRGYYGGYGFYPGIGIGIGLYAPYSYDDLTAPVYAAPSVVVAPPPVVAASPPAPADQGEEPPPAPTDGRARLQVVVPPDAEVWFNGDATGQRGERREFTSPVLSPGHNYQYEIRARWTDGAGRVVERTRAVAVHANALVGVDFTRGEPIGAPTPVPQDK